MTTHLKADECPNCGAPVSGQDKQCKHCRSTFSRVPSVSPSQKGALVLDARHCSQCSAMNPPNAAFCSSCSARLLEPCRHCKKPIAVNSIHCPSCGAVHHGAIAHEEVDDGGTHAVELSRQGRFPEAEEAFVRAEKHNHESGDFYVGWIENYVRWAESFDGDATMQGFATDYRRKARSLLDVLISQCGEGEAATRARQLVINGEARPRPQAKKGACVVATAAYGSDLHADVVRLRQWRDAVLRRSWWGRQFIWWYYRCGPTAARVIERRHWARAVVRLCLRGCLRLIGGRRYEQ